MPNYLIRECYGVMGPRTEVGFTTSTLLNCSAVVFFSRVTGYLGLYHYPGRTLTHPGVLATLTAMLNDARPTAIVIYAARTDTGFGMDMEGVEALGITIDNEYLAFALSMMMGDGCSLEVVQDRSFIGVSATPAGLVFGKPPGGAEVEPPAMAGTTREMRGNIRFYHSAISADRSYSNFLRASVMAEFG